jgi:hypothetical protein
MTRLPQTLVASHQEPVLITTPQHRRVPIKGGTVPYPQLHSLTALDPTLVLPALDPCPCHAPSTCAARPAQLIAC